MRSKLSAVVLLVVQRQQVGSEIRTKISPDCVNVVGIVLYVVVFDQKRRALYAIVMWLTFFEATSPGEEVIFCLNQDSPDEEDKRDLTFILPLQTNEKRLFPYY